MRKQQQIWRDEHTVRQSLPKLSTNEPASGVVWFAQYLRDRVNMSSARIIDIGAGKGRNAIYLAQQGCEAGNGNVPEEL